MKILWLCNLVLPIVREEFGFKQSFFGSWFGNMLHSLREMYDDCVFGLCCPIIDEERMKDGYINGIAYYSFHFVDSGVVDDEMIRRFKVIIGEFKPDIIHIWGTEYPHTLAMVRACEELDILDRVVLDMQGLVSKCKEVIGTGCDNMSYLEYKNNFIANSENELNVLASVKIAIGRTDWTKACFQQVNPKGQYYTCNRIEKDIYYKRAGEWSEKKCKRYTIFMSQGNYPLKGLHLALKAMTIILNKYPYARLICAGKNPLDNLNEYADYIRSLIAENNLGENVLFVGIKNSEEMCDLYCNSNVFLSPSCLEASANSICEAMMIGCPVVSSYVGGISDLIIHKENGLLYPLNEYYMIAYYIDLIFSDSDMAERLSEMAVRSSLKWTDKIQNTTTMYRIYKSVMKKD